MNQISMFDGNQKFRIEKHFRLIELFAGYGSQALALKYLGVKFEHWRTCEWAVKSIQAYKDLHFSDDKTDYSKGLCKQEICEILFSMGISADYKEPMSYTQIKRLKEPTCRKIYNNIKATKNLVSICNAKGKDFNIIDTDKYNYGMTYSHPCFTKDTLVLTNSGYKNIVDVDIGDKVLTHTNTYKEVINVFDNGLHDVYKINAMCVDEIKCTGNHKFYVRERYREWDNNKRMDIRLFKKPEWKELKDVNKNHYLGISINQNAVIPEWKGIDFVWNDGRKTRHKNELGILMDNSDFWWTVGRYVGDGWIKKTGGIIICCSFEELSEITNRIEKLFHYTVVKERTVYKVHISIKELSYFCEQFGRGAKNKQLTSTIIDLPVDLLKSFVDGYMSADGCLCNGEYKATTISRKLVYGVAQCIAKVYHTPYRIYKSIRPLKYKIENRTVNQNDTYQIQYKIEKCKQDKAFYENGHIWFPLNTIEHCGTENVYDIEVDGDNSFTAQNTIVHNCQSLSLAGKKEGMKEDSGTTSSMLWEVKRILSELYEIDGEKSLPQILLMENVTQVHGKNNKDDFYKWCDFLESIGYKNYYKDLNAKNFGVPQNRDRCFMVSILGDYYYKFPQEIPLKLRLKDLLEKNVDEKYYISDKTVEYYINHTQESKDKGNGFEFMPTEGENLARTVTTRAGG